MVTKPVTPRELQKVMRFRSISTAYYHLERLARMGLVEKIGEGYTAGKPEGLLSLYISAKSRLVPRKLIEAAVLTGSALGYTLATRDPLATLILWLIAANAWREYITLSKMLSKLIHTA